DSLLDAQHKENESDNEQDDGKRNKHSFASIGEEQPGKQSQAKGDEPVGQPLLGVNFNYVPTRFSPGHVLTSSISMDGRAAGRGITESARLSLNRPFLNPFRRLRPAQQAPYCRLRSRR